MSKIDTGRDFISVRIAVLTISDTRTLQNDTSGDILVSKLQAAGHILADRDLVTDDVPTIVQYLEAWRDDATVDVVLTTGGTGLTGRDNTPEAHRAVYEKEIPGFGEYFRYISIKNIGTSTLQSRATAGVAKGTYFFALPGSCGAVTDAWDEILKFQLDRRHKPCNFVELMPRLQES